MAGLEDPDLIDLWRDSWAAAGWRPRVLGLADLAGWSGLPRLEARRDFFTGASQNPPEYQIACVERWAAVSRQPLEADGAPVVMADWDVINYGFTPARVFRDWVDGRGEFLFYAPPEWPAPCPAVVCGIPYQFGVFAEWFLRMAERGVAHGHCHDEDLLQAVAAGRAGYPMRFTRIPEAPRPAGPELKTWRRWKRRPTLIHFSNGSVVERPRSVVVRRGHPFDYSA